MKGLNEKYLRLGALLREARESNGITIDAAATMLGMTNLSYLARCERGVSNFPTASLRRAIELYKLDVSEVIEAALADYEESLALFLKGKKR